MIIAAVTTYDCTFKCADGTCNDKWIWIATICFLTRAYIGTIFFHPVCDQQNIEIKLCMLLYWNKYLHFKGRYASLSQEIRMIGNIGKGWCIASAYPGSYTFAKLP